MKNRYFIILSFFGKNYHGWQIQPNAITVQKHINKALSTLLKEKILTIGAGRTDTGVHAKYFVAHFDSEKNNLHDIKDFVFNINGILPNDISIYKIIKVSNKNHARFDAIFRTYKYFISKIKDPFKLETCHYIYGNIDIEKMNCASKLLYQFEDFTSFSKLHTDVKTNNCKIQNANWEQSDDTIVFTITADRFLRNMVRSIVGTLLDIGFGKISTDNLIKIIEKKDRSEAGVSVPAKGLFLWDIKYPYEL